MKNEMVHGNFNEIFTVCPRDCYDTCALRVRVDAAGKILSIRGDSRNPMTRGFTCPRGITDSKRLYQNRIEKPFRRIDGTLVEEGWNSTLDALSLSLKDVLKHHGPEAILFLDFAGNTGLLTGVFPERLWNALGATLTDHSLCSASGHAGLNFHYGSSYGIFPEELLFQKLIVFWGFNAAVSSPHLWSLALKARKSNGAKIVVVDPRRSLTATRADLHIQLRPESDIALIYGLIRHLIGHDLIDRPFIEKWTKGFHRLKAESETWTPKRVEAFTGVSPKLLAKLGDDFGANKPSAVMIGLGLQKCDHGADKVRAVSFIPALLGNHRGFFYGNGDSFIIDFSIISGFAFRNKPPKTTSQVALADDMKKGKFKFVYINCMNPALTLPNQNAFREGISRNDLVVAVHDTHWTRTAKSADIVLPAPSYLEKDDLVIPWSHPYVRCSRKVVPPLGESRSEVWVMREIARRLGLSEPWLYEDPWDVIRSVLKNSIENEDVDAVLVSKEMARLKSRPKDQYPTPSEKIEFYSSIAGKQGLDPLPLQPSLPDRNEGFYTLLTSAVSKYTNTQFQEVFGPIPAVVTINPSDAELLKVEEADTVILANQIGAMKTRVEISDSVPPGLLWSPRQSEDSEGTPQNSLTGSVPQSIGGGPRFNSTIVQILKTDKRKVKRDSKGV